MKFLNKIFLCFTHTSCGVSESPHYCTELWHPTLLHLTTICSRISTAMQKNDSNAWGNFKTVLLCLASLRQNQLTLLLKRRVHNMQTPQWLVSCEVHTRGSVKVSPKATSQFCRDFTVQSWTLQTPRWKPGERLLSGRRGPGSHIEACCLLSFTYCSQNCL